MTCKKYCIIVRDSSQFSDIDFYFIVLHQSQQTNNMFWMYLLYVLSSICCGFVVCIFISKMYFGRTTWCTSQAKLYGKTVIITGTVIG